MNKIVLSPIRLLTELKAQSPVMKNGLCLVPRRPTNNMGDESQALQDQTSGVESLVWDIDSMQHQYTTNQLVAVGRWTKCPTCAEALRKKTPKHTFCCSRCKDRYWNTTDPIRRARAAIFST